MDYMCSLTIQWMSETDSISNNVNFRLNSFRETKGKRDFHEYLNLHIYIKANNYCFSVSLIKLHHRSWAWSWIGFSYNHFIFAGITHLAHTQNFSKTNISYLPDTHTYVSVSGGKKWCDSFSENVVFSRPQSFYNSPNLDTFPLLYPILQLIKNCFNRNLSPFSN